MSAAPAKINPFPGLRPFTQEEDYLFFGREEQTIELLRRLGSNRFVAVVGTSGSGKSSLVRCGLLSQLLGGKLLQAGAAWEIAVTHPGGNPLALLTDALLEADLYDRKQENARENLLATLSRSHFGLVEAVKQAGLAEGTNFLLVVDQFEEIFRFHEAGQTQQEAANEFASLLLEAAAQKDVPIYVVLTMRSDFIGECGQFEGLAEMVNRGEFLIPRLTREQYKRVIEGPIKVAGGQIAPRLLQRLLNDLGQQADPLPCLQHALMRTWNVWCEKGDSEALDLDDYQRVGKMSLALSLHADEIYESLASDRQRELCRGIFQALTVEESNSRGIRRPQRLGRLCQILEVPADELRPIIDAYRQRGVTFLMPSPEVELTVKTIIDISHESLMRVWTQLRQWVEEETQAAGIYHRLSESADLNERGKAGLYRDPELGIALAWREAKRPNAAWAERYRRGFATAMEFLKASQEASLAEEQAREAARQRELEQARQLAEAQQLRLDHQQRAARRLRLMVAGLAVVALIAGVACVAALLANRRAIGLAAIARQNEQKANDNASRAEQSQKETASALAVVASQKAQVEGSLSKAESAERLARTAEEAGRKLLYTTDMQLAPFVWRDDRSTAEQLRVLLAKHIPEERMKDDGGRMKGENTAAEGSGSSFMLHPSSLDLRGFEWNYYQHLLQSSATVFSGHAEPVVDAAFTTEGPLVTLDQKGELRRWDLNSQAENSASRRHLPPGTGDALPVLSPDGRLAALAQADKVRVYDTSTGDVKFAVDSANPTFCDLIFSRDADRLVIVDDKIRWLNTANGAVIASFDWIIGRVGGLALSVDGLTLAVVGHGGLGDMVSVFRLDAAGRKVTTLAKGIGNGGSKYGFALTPDGGRIAVGYRFSGAVSVFDTATGRAIARHTSASASPIPAMAFSGDGAKLATADSEGTIKIWADVEKLDPKSAAILTLKGHQGAIDSVRFSSDSKRLVTASSDKTARVWDLENAGAAIRPLEALSKDRVLVTRFSRDGQLIAVASGGSVRLWDAATGRLVRELPAVGDGAVCSVAFSPTDDRLLAVGYGGTHDVSYVALWDIDAGTELARFAGAIDRPGEMIDANVGAVGALAFSPDGKYLVAGFGTKNFFVSFSFPLVPPLKVWEVATRRLIHRLDGHRNYCVSLDFSRDGTLLASGSRDGTAIIWSTKTWKAMHTLRNPGPASGYLGMFEDVAFSPDGKTLALASRGGSVQLWDVATGKILQTLKGHSNAVQAVVFSPDGRTLASGSSDETVRLWNVETRRELMQLDRGGVELGQVHSLAFSPDGQHLLVGGNGAAFWSTTPVVWNDPDRAAEKLGRLLNSNADFRSRIRMFSENLGLHEALAKLDAKDRRVKPALAAAQANWHASRKAWPEAVAAFDRLAAADPASPGEWLRTPGLLRLATALVHRDRPGDAAALLAGGARRRTADGIPPPALQGSNDPATGELLNPLREAVNNRLTKAPRDAGLLELRAELAGQGSDANAQVADYTAAIEALAQQKPEAAAADLKRLYGRRGNAYVALKQWQQAVDDYAHVVTTTTTDEELLTNQATALAKVILKSPSEVMLKSAVWTVLKPHEAKSELGATFSILPDDSILVSGANRFKDLYHVVLGVGTDVKLTAVRLEALTHDSLPNHGPGRNPFGSFAQISWNVTAASPDRKDPITLVFDRAWADHELPGYPIANDGHWNIATHEGKNSTAIWSMSKPISLAAGTKLTFTMQCQIWNDAAENLGHFRLSVLSDPAAIERVSKLFAAAKLGNPWEKLAVAYQLKGDQQAIDRLIERRPNLAGAIGDLFTREPNQNWQRAVEIYSMGITPHLTDADLLSRRARAYGALGNWEAAAADWSRAATGNPDGAKLLAEFERRLASAGQTTLAKVQFEKCRALYERMLEADPQNEVLAAELAELLFAKHENEDPTRWTILQPTKMKSEGGANLTRLADGSILASGINPDQDTYTITTRADLGRIRAFRLEALTDASLPRNGPGRDGGGGFELNAFRVFSGTTPTKLAEFFATNATNPPHAIIEDKIGEKEWGIWPQMGQTHTAFFSADFAPAVDDELKFELYFARGVWKTCNLGRFRLSASGDPAIFERERQRVAARNRANPWAMLASAYHLSGDQRALDKLVSRHPEAASVLAMAYQSAGRTREAIPVLAKASAANPTDTLLALKVAALQAWFGQEKELADSRQRILAFAKETNEAETAERVAKACSILPSTDKGQLELAVALGRRAVKLGSVGWEWGPMALGMAEYRSGNDAPADLALLAAAKAGPTNPHATGTSAFFRAMSLFRQGKKDEARKLAIAAAAKMEPLPKDENNPLANLTAPPGGGDTQEYLIMWLAYKEAKALIKFDAAPATSATPTGN
jgi:WD40 repeat protein/tetratricopeptide (TPR) repeat protein